LVAPHADGGARQPARREQPGQAESEHDRAPFSIVFRGPPGVLLPQRIYRPMHDGIGAFDLFPVPIGPDDAGMRYEAVFT
jgi:hypothetical protein